MSEQASTVETASRFGRILATVCIAVFLCLILILGAASFALSTQAGSRWALGQAMQSLNSGGIPVAFEGVQGTIFRGLSFERIHYADEGGSYTVEGLRTSWNPYSLLSAQLVLSDVWMSSLRVELFESDAPASRFDPAIIQNPLPMGISIPSLRIERLDVVQQGEGRTVRSITLGAELGTTDLEIRGLAATTEGLQLGGQASMEFRGNRPLSATLDWQYTATIDSRQERFNGRAELGGDLSAIEIEHVLEAPMRIRSTGRLDTGLIAGELHFDLEHVADTLVLPIEVPADYELNDVILATSGTPDEVALGLQAELFYEQYPALSVSADAVYRGASLSLNDYSLSTNGNSIQGSATLDLSDVLHLEGDYALTLESIEAFVDLPTTVDIAGFAASGNFDIALPDEGVEGRLTIEAEGGQIADFPMQANGELRFSAGVINIEGLQLRSENNMLTLDGSYGETLNFDWSVSVESLSEFLVGSEGGLQGSGNLEGDPAAPNIAGSLSGNDIVYGQFGIDGLALEFQRLGNQLQGELTIGSASFTGENQVETLSPIALAVSGSESRHSIELSATSRFGDLQARASGSLGDLQTTYWSGSLENAAVDTPFGSWSTQASTTVNIASAGIDVGETCLAQADTRVCFDFQQAEDGGISAAGSLAGFPLDIFNNGQSVARAAGPKLVQDELLHPPQLPDGATLAGSVDGDFSLALPAGGELEMEFDIAAIAAGLSISPERLAGDEPIDEEMLLQEYNFETLQLLGSGQSRAWRLSAAAEILRENVDDSAIDVRGAISANVEIAAGGDLEGSLEAALEDLRWLQAMIPGINDVGGVLNGRVNLGGSIGAPEATGSIDLEGASVSIENLGITLADIHASINSSGPESVQLVGSMQSAEGSIEFNGEIQDPFQGAPMFSAQVQGDNFQLSSVPNLELSVSPNAVVSIDDTRIEVIGSLDIPTLNLTMEELPESAVDVSRDVVIVNYPSDRPDLARSLSANEATLFDLPLTGEIDITLGDNVSFNGFGMSARLEGNLNIQQTATGSNRTYGELSLVDGNYEMYRQSLDITQGKFLFFGAYDNPGIDLRATREVDDYTVGVLMNGTLKNLSSELFSTPALPENDIIAVLVTGRPFSEAGAADGDAMIGAIAKLGLSRSEGLTDQVRNRLGLDVLAVDASDDINNSVLTIGKYLTPDIFIRYGIGLFDSQSKVAVDYTITERIKLQAESGEYQSVDVIYSVER